MGIISIDWYDVKASISNAGIAHLGVGNAKGKDKAEQAAKMAMSNPFIETNISDAKGIITHFICTPDIGLEGINSALETIINEAHPDATILFHVTFDTSLEDEMRITLIATGFDSDKKASDTRRQMQQAEAKSASVEEAPVKEGGSDIDDILSMLNGR